MGKSFQQLIVENDQEYTVHVCSVQNIHNAEVMDFIRLALLPYDLREIKVDGYKPMGDDAFAGYTGYPVYTVTVKLGLDVTNEKAEERVATLTHIDKDQVIVHHKGESLKRAEEDNSDDAAEGAGDAGEPAEMGSEQAQKLAGEKRIDDFLKELEADRKEREKAVPDFKVEEAFCTTHIALKAFNSNVMAPKGFYVVERESTGDSKSVLHISGPFKGMPENYPLVPTLSHEGINVVKVMTESHGAFGLEVSTREGHRFLGESVKQTVTEAAQQEVTVTDTDTGKTYTAAVRANDDATARDLAVDSIAQKHDLSPDRLVAGAPEE